MNRQGNDRPASAWPTGPSQFARTSDRPKLAVVAETSRANTASSQMTSEKMTWMTSALPKKPRGQCAIRSTPGSREKTSRTANRPAMAKAPTPSHAHIESSRRDKA